MSSILKSKQFKADLGLDPDTFDAYMQECYDVATDLEHKGDIDHVMPKRAEVAANLMIVKAEMEKIHEIQSSQGISDQLMGILTILRKAILDCQKSLEQYNDQYLTQNDSMVKERDVLTQRRTSLTRVTSINGF